MESPAESIDTREDVPCVCDNLEPWFNEALLLVFASQGMKKEEVVKAVDRILDGVDTKGKASEAIAEAAENLERDNLTEGEQKQGLTKSIPIVALQSFAIRFPRCLRMGLAELGGASRNLRNVFSNARPSFFLRQKLKADLILLDEVFWFLADKFSKPKPALLFEAVLAALPGLAGTPPDGGQALGLHNFAAHVRKTRSQALLWGHLGARPNAHGNGVIKKAINDAAWGKEITKDMISDEKDAIQWRRQTMDFTRRDVVKLMDYLNTQCSFVDISDEGRGEEPKEKKSFLEKMPRRVPATVGSKDETENHDASLLVPTTSVAGAGTTASVSSSGEISWAEIAEKVVLKNQNQNIGLTSSNSTNFLM